MHGVEKHAKKDETGKRDVTVIGIDVVGGVRLRAHAWKALLVLLALVEVLKRRRASPKCIDLARKRSALLFSKPPIVFNI